MVIDPICSCQVKNTTYMAPSESGLYELTKAMFEDYPSKRACQI
uniref:Predicted protein n=1 Tax=Hordeum vulgare subsp. vulgare TaxID=112509 RepID=F2D6K8_HORVV|nr:predicted protein [Hordeum vulgare subsp. vulgare]